MQTFDRLQEFNRQHSETKEVYRKMQQWYIKHTPENGVFCPMYEMSYYSPTLLLEFSMLKDKSISNLSYSSYKYANEMHVFGTWRNSLGIYKIDDDVIGDVAKSLIPYDTPISIFERLPEWCVYLDIQNLNYAEKMGDIEYKILGFWALFDVIMINNKYQHTLKLVMNATGMDDILPIIDLPLDDSKTVEQSIQHLYKSEEDKDPFINAQYVKADTEMARILLSMLLWLCAEEPDISNIVGEPINKNQLRIPKYRVNKKTGAFIPPDRPTLYEIGKRLGGEIRTYNEKIGAGDSRISSRVRPHIRRGHWHGVWAGTGQNKNFKIYWQPAIFVNAH